jgi:hypothetical protein
MVLPVRGKFVNYCNPNCILVLLFSDGYLQQNNCYQIKFIPQQYHIPFVSRFLVKRKQKEAKILQKFTSHFVILLE